MEGLYRKSGEEICRECEEDCQYKHDGDIEHRAENANLLNNGKADVFNEADITFVEVVVIDLQRVGHGRRDCDIDGKGDANHLHVVPCAEVIKPEGEGQQEVEDD